MVIAFYIDEMNFRGVANSTYNFALNNEKILKNKSLIFFNKENKSNKLEMIKKFKKKFITIPISNFEEIENFEKKFKINYIYTQKGGERDKWVSKKIKTLVHCVYPQFLGEVHGFKYAFISKWLSKNFSNNKLDFIPYIVDIDKTKQNLKKKLKIKKNFTTLGYHGGESSFDINFIKDAILQTVKIRKDIFFVFLNVNKFCSHSRIKFLKGTSSERYKKKFINTCDGMIYGRSLGESFGLSCAEFSVVDKKIISYKFNRHRSHVYHTSKDIFLEYSSYKNLLNILLKFKFNRNKKYLCEYKKYNARIVMKIFEKVFLSNKPMKKITFLDYLYNLINHINMYKYYIKHKIYNHYYKFIESKLNITKA